MTVQVGLCQTFSKTILLVFPPGGSNVSVVSADYVVGGGGGGVFVDVDLLIPTGSYGKSIKQLKYNGLILWKQ